MTRDSRYDILFEPVEIGPVTARNRFYQVPHCTGMGYLRPRTLAAMRGVKAEGGWAVVCTEYNSIHPSSDDLPHISTSLWDDSDIRAHTAMTDLVHEHGSLAGAELWYGGARSPNFHSREVAMDVACLPNLAGHPFQSRSMDRTDIANLRRWHRKAALRARDAGFDIVYVYATHGYLLSHFLDARTNTRTDEYGGSLENRTRLVRELIEETKEAVGDRCAVAVRFKADETAGEDGVPQHGERREMFGMLAELPDLWDINIADYTLEMGVSRFTKEAALEPYMDWVKPATSKPVVTVGRFTSPDTMVDQVRRGVTDFIGAARPSIADPFLPRKIEEGRVEDIRECIGCNICYTGDSFGVPIRCTQNPAMGEEWRRGWHPERAPAGKDASRVLVVGAGPAGLEAARTLGLRGYGVTLAEAARDLGGRVLGESRLPGMGEYIRVRDYREQQIAKMDNVEVFRESRMAAKDVLDLAPDHVVVATGARWRRDRFDGGAYVPVATGDATVLTPDDIMDGNLPEGPVVVFDGDNYYMAGVVAERLAMEGLEVFYVTAEDSVSSWTGHTVDRRRIHARLMERGIGTVTGHNLTAFDGTSATLECVYSGAVHDIGAAGAVLVTQREPEDGLYREILATADGDVSELPFTLSRVGDADAPGIVAQAVYSGHRYAMELDEEVDIDQPARHDRVDAGSPPARSSPPPAAAEPAYLKVLLDYYEEEISGEAWFRALAEVVDDPEEKGKINLLADVEAHCAAITAPLIERHGLSPRPEEVLVEEGRTIASKGPQTYPGMIEYWRRTFPVYITDFHNLEAMAPEADRAILGRMSEHEVVAVAFLEAEHAGAADSTAPLRKYLETPVETAPAK